MALTTRTITSDGATTLHTIDFTLGYINQEYIYVYLEEGDFTAQLSYTWVSSNQIQLSEPVATGENYVIRRIVPRDTAVNDYTNGAILHERNLDNSYAQLLMIFEEINDGFTQLDGSFGLTGILDMEGNRIINAGEALFPTDVPNLGQLEGYQQTSGQSAIEAQASADDAAASVIEVTAISSVFTNTYAGVGTTLPTGVQPDGIRFHYIGAVYPLGEYIYLPDFIDPVTLNNWHIVSGMGVQGAQGAQGVQGSTGQQGIQGLQGETGPQGNTGPEGNIGVTGDQGLIGVTGPAGPNGQTGSQGVQGIAGDNGTSFTVDDVGLESGRAAHDAELDGYSYLSTDHVNAIGTGSLFVKLSNTSGDWSTAIPFGVGPQGPQGIQGIDGVQGPAGVVGPDGVQGDQGANGNTGATGIQGEQGIIGPTGPQGEEGILGAAGPQGAQGGVGADGPQGGVGPTGVTGQTGTQGTPGVTGDTGATGPTGDQGATGDQGIRGSRSYYISGQLVWDVTVANTAIPDTPLENDLVVQYDDATGFSETRRYNGTAPATNDANWLVVEKTVNAIPIIVAGVASAFAITDTGSINFGNEAGSITQGADCITLGTQAGKDNQGTSSVAIGTTAGSIDQGIDSVAIGTDAGGDTQGAKSVAIGKWAGQVTQKANSVAIGYIAGRTNQDDFSVAIGAGSGQTNQSFRATAVGSQAGNADMGADCTALGYGAAVSGGGFLNSTALGAFSSYLASNQFTLGDAGITNLRCNDTSISSLSDKRDKTAVIDCPIGLEYIDDLRPIEFEWKYRQGHYREGIAPTKNGTKEIGFLAQDLKAVQETYDIHSLNSYQEYEASDSTGGIDIMEADSGKLLPVLVKAIQELSAKVKLLEA